MPAHGAVAREGPGTWTKPRRNGRVNVLQRGTATAAAVLGAILHPKPMAAGGTARIQTLYSRARQILHRASFC
jgi:hypothetical protein